MSDLASSTSFESDPVALVISRLGEQAKVKSTSRGWEALCPAHEDQRASLGLAQGNDGRALLYCQAGCTLPAICSALGIRVGQLFPPRSSNLGLSFVREPRPTAAAKRVRLGAPKVKAPLGKIVAIYEYVDEHGGHLFQVLRFEPKDFRQRRRDPNGKNGWSWKVAGVRQVVFRLPKVIESVKVGAKIWVVEGEKDVLRLEAIQLVATCNAGGASEDQRRPKWRREHAEALAGAKRVVVIADKDGAGRAHAAAVAASVFGIVAEVKVLELQGDSVKDASDWIAQGGTREQLEQLAEAASGWTPPPDRPQPTGGDDGGGPEQLPLIHLGDRQLREVVKEGWHAIHRANTPPRVFWRAGLMARLAEGPVGVFIQEMGAVAIYGHLARVANWRAAIRGELVNVYPDVPTSKDMQDAPDRALPELEAVIASPVFDAAGNLLSEPGYHPGAKLWLHQPEGFIMDPVPEHPTPEQVAAAQAFLLGEILVDFDFASQADRANAVAMLLAPCTRRLIGGLAPLYVVEAPSAGTGKSLLTDMVSIPATGQVCRTTTYTHDQDELRKRITSLLIGAQPVVLIDNLPQEDIDSPVLAAATTAEIWEDRMLGFNQMVQIPNRAVWLVTGTNPILSEELTRRCVPIRIDQKIDRPWKSKRKFRHKDLRRFARKHRAEFDHALLTLVSAWLSAGRPLSETRLGSFENWSETVGGILEVVGVSGFLGNTDELYAQSDRKGQEWREFVRAWWAELGNRQVKVGDLVNLVGRQNLLPTALKGKTFRARVSELGKALRDVRGKRYEHLALTDCEDKHANCTVYQLVDAKPAEPIAVATPAQRELAPHWSDGAPLPEESSEIDRGDDPDAY